MKQQFVGQPFGEHSNLVDYIDAATLGGATHLMIGVAWAKRSGLGRVWDALQAFRAQGGHLTLIVGVSEGGATKEGLELALALADESYVFHDPRRTFHPKVYWAYSDSSRWLLVGSSNLTAGGLSWNYEASLWLEWAAGENDELAETVESWFDRLIGESNSCMELSPALIEQLASSSDITLGTEAASRRVSRAKADTPEDNDSSISGTISGLFQPVLIGLRKLPGLSSKLGPIKSPDKSSRTSTKAAAPGSSAAPGSVASDPEIPFDDVVRRWFRVMDHTAAQQAKSASSNPTGNLRLSQGEAEVNHKVYFRRDFFGGLPWTPTDGKFFEQEVVVRFHTWVDGSDLGNHDIRISHDPGRISGQGNVPTVLHWGSLGPTLRQENFIGYFATLERLDDGRFNLIISHEPRGDYMS